MKDINTPMLICWVLRVIKESLDELVPLPDVDCIADMPALILVRIPTVNDRKIVHHITVSPSQQLRHLHHCKMKNIHVLIA